VAISKFREKGKFHGSSGNSAARRKLWAPVMTGVPTSGQRPGGRLYTVSALG